jgi:NitT/TauT family transport system permease protein
VLDLIRRSPLLRFLRVARRRVAEAAVRRATAAPVPQAEAPSGGGSTRLRGVLVGILGVAALAAAVWGTSKLVGLLTQVPRREWGALAGALGATFLRTAGALGLAVLWTVPAGILIGRSATWSRRLQPVVQVVASFPAPMIFPLVTAVMIALHVPFAITASVLMLLGAQWYVLFNVLAGASAVPHDLGEAADTYGMTGTERWKKLFLPAVFPYLVTGLITAAGGAWNASIVAETLQYKGRTLETFGLGSTITRATATANFPLLAAGVLTMSAALIILNRAFWRPLYRLAESKYTLNR